MTTEEKAKAYDEALERARIHSKVGEVDKANLTAICQDIFPELRESEDERIRKELKEAFESYDIESKWNGIPIRSIFAWLEKQKEQKPAEKPDLVVQLKEHLANTPKEQLEKEWKELEPWGNIGPTVHEFLYGKPAEWSEEDELTVDSAIFWLKKRLLSEKAEDISTDSCRLSMRKTIERLESLRPSWKPSEEQMNCLCAAVDAAIRKHNESVSGYEPARILKSLYEQLKKLT